MRQQQSITFIGSGNVATILAKNFYTKGFSINQIISRNIDNAKKLAEKVSANSFSDNISLLTDDADFFIISIPDDAIFSVIEHFPFCLTDTQIVMHTSGSFDEKELQNISKNYGCFYPLQTFTKNSDFEMVKTPLLYNGNSDFTCKKIVDLTEKTGLKSFYIQHDERQKLHVAAVLANNFTNHLLSLAQNYCIKNHLDFQLLWPLIEEGIQKAKNIGPVMAQTGPAKRKDVKTINKHLELIGNDDTLLHVYKILTNSINQLHHTHENPGRI
ncbi:MAG: DUF2520 domain-containing protein [Saprospiraceae bacterium]|nr:DUF2520 domain-containing protein [Saprospiraceae bacterium]